MKKIILILLLISISFQIQITTWTSSELWNYIEEEILINKTINPNYFIIDPNKYLSIVGSEKMNKIEETQKEVFEETKIPNYVIFISNLNESIENFTFIISQKLKNKFPEVNISNSIVSVFSIFDRKMRIRTGSKLKYKLKDSTVYDILIRRRKELGKRNYDKVTIDLLNDIISYNSNRVFKFFFGIFLFFLLFLLFGVFYSIYLTNKENNEVKKLNKIKDFLKKVKTNKKIISENCVICLNNLVDNNNDNSNVSTLLCGHQYHTKCIADWMLKNKKCPLCRDIINTGENNEEKKLNSNEEPIGERLSEIIWEVQTEINPEYNNYSYNDLWTSNKDNNDYDSNYCNNDNCSNDFDYDCGGGATADW